MADHWEMTSIPAGLGGEVSFPSLNFCDAPFWIDPLLLPGRKCFPPSVAALGKEAEKEGESKWWVIALPGMPCRQDWQWEGWRGGSSTNKCGGLGHTRCICKSTALPGLADLEQASLQTNFSVSLWRKGFAVLKILLCLLWSQPGSLHLHMQIICIYVNSGVNNIITVPAE